MFILIKNIQSNVMYQKSTMYISRNLNKIYLKIILFKKITRRNTLIK
jgi:hypothetical protein